MAFSGGPVRWWRAACLSMVLGLSVVLTACGTGQVAVPKPRHLAATGPITIGPGRTTVPSTTAPPATTTVPTTPSFSPLPEPAALAPSAGSVLPVQGTWSAEGRPVDGIPAVYETTMVPPGGTSAAGIAWMDTRLLSATLYSGSGSPGGGPYVYTAPVLPAQASSLVAAFNGGFYMPAAQGGYYTEGRLIDPLVAGAASLVVYADGSVDIGAWGSDVTMTPNVVSVRQNLVPLVAGGQPTAMAAGSDWLAWGDTCGATSCAASVPGVEQQWRSGVGITADGALVYAAGPTLDPLQLAQLLVDAGAIRGMQLDINPNWPVFATYDPGVAGGLASPANGSRLLPSMAQGPATFFDPAWARDFVTMSARSSPLG